MHSVLFLILAFVNAAGLFVLMGAEFLAMILIVVYVGAVAVLFLFVVMMLDVDFAELRQGFLNYLPVGALIGGHAAGRAPCRGRRLGDRAGRARKPSRRRSRRQATSTIRRRIGLVLYTRYVYFFQAAGVILLVAMIGAIVMTLQHKPNVRRQNIADQVARNRASAIEVVKVKSGQGLS